MSRLASFRGPSTPSTSPVQPKRQSSLTSPVRIAESTFHRKTRSYLQELRSIAETWEDLVYIDGLKAAQGLVDARTDLSNELALLPNGLPRSHLVSEKLAVMEKHLIELDNVISKLRKQFRKMSLVIDNMEKVIFEAHKAKGWRWVHEEPLWVTWSLEKFVSSISDILVPYHRSLNLHVELVDAIRSHSVSFKDSSNIIQRWVEEPWLEDSGWDKWSDIFAVEVENWNGPR